MVEVVEGRRANLRRDDAVAPASWIDYQTRKTYTGGWHRIEAGEIPVVMLVRDGLLIPTAKLAQSTSEIDWPVIELVPFRTLVGHATGLVCLPSNNVLRRVTSDGTIVVPVGQHNMSALSRINVRPAGRRPALLCFAALAFAAEAQHTQPYVWKSVQMVGGGFVDGIVFHPTAKGVRYARTDIGGAYRWNDATNRWEPLLDWLPYEDTNLMGAGVVGGLPVPDALGVRTAEGCDHCSAKRRRIDRTAAFEIGEQQAGGRDQRNAGVRLRHRGHGKRGSRDCGRGDQRGIHEGHPGER